jgi:hypothetical protein
VVSAAILIVSWLQIKCPNFFRKFSLSERRFETSIQQYGVSSQTLVSVCPLLVLVSVSEEDAHGAASPTCEYRIRILNGNSCGVGRDFSVAGRQR